MKGPPPAPPLRVLLVEDDPVNRQLARAVIVRADRPAIRGAVLHEAHTLAEARAIVNQETVDVIVLDMHLPDGLGAGFAAELRTWPAESRPSILALTASVLPVEQQAAMEAGCDAFLAKPYLPADLIAAIDELAVRRTTDRSRQSTDR